MPVETEHRERGIALVLVIWALALLAAIAIAVTADGRAGRRVAHNLEKAAQAQALADGGAWWGIVRLLDGNAQTAPHVDGRAYAVALGGEAVTVAIEDESGKIDLNAAPAILLQGLLRAGGFSDSEAGAMTAAIEARRREQQRSGGNRIPAFAAAEDLHRITGMDYDRFLQLAPFVTVYSGSPRLDPRTAPREVLLAVPGLRPAMVDAYLRERLSGQEGGPALAALYAAPEAAAHLARSPVTLLTVRSTARLNDGTEHVRIAVVELRRHPQRPVLIHKW